MKKLMMMIVLVVLVATLGACSPAEETAQGKSQATTEEYSSASVKAVPYPLGEMKEGGWLERMNIRERLIRFSNPNKISYITLLTKSGQVFATFTVKGKVSNTSSQLTTSETVNDYCGSGECKIATPAPMDDGTWGPSEDAIFFFDTAGVYHQWPGEYLLSDAPQDLSTPPVLVYNTGSKPTSVGDEAMYGG
ncbi:MAG: hypothetical protein WCP56_03135 [Candidatus Saccharibacteria bacterium]